MAYTVAALIALLDQITKALIEANLPLGSSRPVIDGFFYLVHAQNRGAAWSIFAGLDWSRLLLSTISLAASWLLAAAIGRSRHRTGTLLLGLILGGSVGNLVDRIRFGYVTDFVQLVFGGYHFPAFNVADAAITTGAVLIALFALFNKMFLGRLLPWLDADVPRPPAGGLDQKMRDELQNIEPAETPGSDEDKP